MKKIRSMSSVLVLVSLGILGVSVFVFNLSFRDFKKNDSLKTAPVCQGIECTAGFFREEQSALEKRLLRENAAKVYADILVKYAHTAPNSQHGIAHIFGEVLYKTTGLSGITVCDNSFAFGCFHGFLFNAIADKDIASINDLDRMCIEKFGEYNLGCQHGIGHGIAEHYGSQNLDQSLDACATLSWKHRLMGCSGGVFMEYMMPTLSGKGAGSVQVKPLNPNDPYAPCDNIKHQFKPECFYNLGNYFYHGTNQNIKEGFLLCENTSESGLRKTCLLGFGNAIYSNTRDINQTISYCELASNKENELSCRAGAAWILYTNPATRLDTKKLCQDLKEPDLKQCLNDSNLLQMALKT